MERMIAEAARAAMAKSGGVVPGAAGKRKDVGDDDAEPKRPPLPVGDPADPYAAYYDADTDKEDVSDAEEDVKIRMRLHDRVCCKTKFSEALRNGIPAPGVIVAEVGERRYDVRLDDGSIERNVPERLLTAQQQPWAPMYPLKKSRCLKCEGCLAKECGECDPCLDRESRGGPGRIREICVKRRCAELGYAGQPKAPPSESTIIEQLRQYLAECGAGDDAARGWTAKATQRTGGDTEGHYDIYFFSPQGKKCRSRAEVARLIGVVPVKNGKRYSRNG